MDSYVRGMRLKPRVPPGSDLVSRNCPKCVLAWVGEERTCESNSFRYKVGNTGRYQWNVEFT
jgi:hypothetical protein